MAGPPDGSLGSAAGVLVGCRHRVILVAGTEWKHREPVHRGVEAQRGPDVDIAQGLSSGSGQVVICWKIFTATRMTASSR